MIMNFLKKEKPTDGEIQVSYHTKPPCLLAISVDKESSFFLNPLLTMGRACKSDHPQQPIVLTKTSGRKPGSGHFYLRSVRRVCSPKLLPRHLRQFGWQLGVLINTVTLDLLVVLFLSTLRCKTLCEANKPFCMRLDDQFWCFDCFRDTQKWLIRKHNGGGSGKRCPEKPVLQRNT